MGKPTLEDIVIAIYGILGCFTLVAMGLLIFVLANILMGV